MTYILVGQTIERWFISERHREYLKEQKITAAPR